jgi:hypothetical protein
MSLITLLLFHPEAKNNGFPLCEYHLGQKISSLASLITEFSFLIPDFKELWSVLFNILSYS